MANNNFSGLTDQELISKIKENPDFLGLVYKNCKKNAVRYMYKMSNGAIGDYELEDIIHDAILVLYENIVNSEFVLTCKSSLVKTLGQKIRQIFRRHPLWNASSFWKSESTTRQHSEPYINTRDVKTSRKID
jgi:hypothetical protein